MNRLLILTIVLVGGLTLTACTTSERATDGKGSDGGAQQVNSKNDGNKTTENKSAETVKMAEKEVLWDFRQIDNSKPQTFHKAETEAVAKYLFGETNSKIEITNRFQGAFTKPNAKETLYYLSGCKDENNDNQFTTDCPHSSWSSEGRIAIFDGTTPVAKFDEALGGNVLKVTDVNGDGKNEILSTAFYGQSGIYTANVTLGQISDGKYEAIKGSSGSYGWNCAFGGGKKDSELSARATVISYVPTNSGKMPEFAKEYYKGQCKNGEIDESSWRKTDEKDLTEFIDSIS